MFLLLLESVIRKKPGIWIYRNNGKWVLDPTHIREYSSDREFILLLERNGLQPMRTEVTLCKYPVLDILIRVLIKVGLLAPDKARYWFIRNRFLNAMRVASLPILGFYIIEVSCEKGS